MTRSPKQKDKKQELNIRAFLDLWQNQLTFGIQVFITAITTSLHRHKHLEYVVFLGLHVLYLGTVVGLTVSLVTLFLVLVSEPYNIDSQIVGTCLSP